MNISGNLKKMRSELRDTVHYFLPLGKDEVHMNDIIGSELKLEHTGNIHCVKCGNLTKKSFAQGFCYPCFISAPETEECVLRPELCKAHEGSARDMNFAEKHCLIEHVVYLSLTSGVKVGVTRNTQVPTRWIDQGAVSAIELARTPNRYLAGAIEVFLKDYLKDKTNWRAMLKNEYDTELDLFSEKERVAGLLPDDLASYISQKNDLTQIKYPVENYPLKVGSLNFDKEALVSGRLVGIKGQYLLFEGDKVINIRKFGGYEVQLSC